MPGESPVMVSAKPERVNCDEPKAAATSGRSSVSVVAPTKVGEPDGEPPSAGIGYAQAWIASMPAPEAAAGSSAQPAIGNGCVTVWFARGTSTDIAGGCEDAIVIRTIAPLL